LATPCNGSEPNNELFTVTTGLDAKTVVPYTSDMFLLSIIPLAGAGPQLSDFHLP